METRKVGKKQVAVFGFTKATKGLNWNVKEETEPTTLADANPEVKTTKNGDEYLRLTVGGINYAQFRANFVMGYVNANELNPKEGDEVEIPLDAEFKLTPNGVEFLKN